MRKYSHQRSAILEELRAVSSHPTAAELYARVRLRVPKLSLGTVYRNLAQLAAEGEVLRLSTGDGTDRFDAVTQPHDHLSCTRCGRLYDLPPRPMPELERWAAEASGARITGRSLVFYGVCSCCLENQSSEI